MEAQVQANVSVKKHGIIPKAPGVSWWALLLLWAVFGINAIGREMMNRVTPAIVAEYHIDATTWGLIAALVMIANSALALPGARWSDAGGHGWARKYRHLPVVIGYTLFCVLTGLNVFTVSLGGFIILQMLKSGFSGWGESIEVTSVAEWWPEEYRGFAQGAHHAGYPWGSLIGGALIALILAQYGEENWRLTFLLIPLLQIPVFAIYWIFANPRNFKTFQEKSRKMGLTPTIQEDATEAVAKPGAMGRALKNPNIVMAAFGSFLGIVSYAGLGFWLAPYLSFVGKMSISAAAGWSVIFTITGGIGQIFWGTLSDKIGRKVTLIITFLWLAVGLYLMQYTVNGLGWLIGIQLFAGMATNAIFPVLYSLATDSSEPGAAGIANSINLFGLYIGGISPFVLGIFINLGGGWNTQTGYVYGLWFLSACMVIAALAILLFTRETRGPWKGRDFSLVSMEKCNVK
ncbi:MFS transporter [Paradesulfitobacterium ferrireducens]|uniref:MFS transporter n=1 Tax=Paradesulfitobacterium ferrireducens TaxID=2816476 RepID=UPI001A90990D|nr:MFS transporter [Paradesulfitobacterium ferrireducens]